MKGTNFVVVVVVDIKTPQRPRQTQRRGHLSTPSDDVVTLPDHSDDGTRAYIAH